MPFSTFTHSAVVDMSKEKDWQSHLGLLDWDSTNIVFTKRTLIEFLKYTGTTVDPNFTNISKLPRYAKFGTLTASSVASDAQVPVAPETSSVEGFVPSRHIRDPPGGRHTDIFKPEEEDDALSQAPPRPTEEVASDPAPAANVEADESYRPEFKPSRRVNDIPGGKDTVANLWDGNYVEEFKPTRRVRQGPGGQDHITGIF